MRNHWPSYIESLFIAFEHSKIIYNLDFHYIFLQGDVHEDDRRWKKEMNGGAMGKQGGGGGGEHDEEIREIS